MTRRLLISALPGEMRAAWLDGDRLIDLVVQRETGAAAPGDLYLGRIAQLDKALDAAAGNGWTVVDMKNDWRVVHPFELE